MTMDRAHRTLPDRLLSAAISVTSLLFFAISSFNPLALFFCALVVLWLYGTRQLALLLPVCVTLLGGYVLLFSERHMILLWTSLIAALWMGWNTTPAEPSILQRRGWMVVALAIVIAEQICWTGAAAWRESHEPFDGGREAAVFLSSSATAGQVAGFGFHSVSLQPYFSRSAYANYKTSYWPWRVSADPDLKLEQVVAAKPLFILVGEGYLGDATTVNQFFRRANAGDPLDDDASFPAYLETHGYRETHRFCGRQPAHFGYSEETCQLLFQPD